MKKIFIIITTFFFVSITSAQISGYMGNRFSFIYNGGLGFPHITSVSNDGVKVLPTFHNGFNFEYIYKNNAAVGVRYKLGLTTGKNDNAFNNYTGFTEKYAFNSHTIGAYLKFYRRNSLAPIGLYTIMGLSYQNLVLKNIVRPNNVDNSVITNQTYVYQDVLFNIGLGRNWIIADRLLLGVQFEAGLPFESMVSAALLNSSNDSRYNGYKRTAILSRVNLASEIIRLSLNIGFLAF